MLSEEIWETTSVRGSGEEELLTAHSSELMET